MDTILEVRNLKKYFDTPKGKLHAVDDVTFTIEKGKTIGVVGESGCGKSTLGRTILHMIDSTQGQILFRGQDITHPSKAKLHELRESMQMIFQDPYSSLNPRMNVSSIISEPLLLTNRYGNDEIDERTNELMQTVGLASRLAYSYPHELDGGRRQRIGIARAIALNPEFVVCDEPVSALDVSIQAQILNLMQDLQESRGLTYLFITHDLSVVKYISTEICVMYLGQLVEKSPSRELFNNPLHPYTKALLSAIPIPDIHAPRRKTVLKGEVASPINPSAGCRFAGRCPFATQDCMQTQKLVETGKNHFVSCCRVDVI